MNADLLAAGWGPDDRQVLSVRQINERIQAALEQAFGARLWVRGEVQRLPSDADRRQHLYFELHETGSSGAAEYQIPVALMGWDRQRYGLGRYLDGSDPDFRLANQMEVCLECQVDFYPKFGKLSLKIVGIDPSFSLGKLEARRREVLAFLARTGLLERQAALHLPELPYRVGLITAAGSAAERDFMTGLEASGRPFGVTLRGAKMQGEQLQAEVIRALQAHARSGVDVIVITRGGGSRADLSWFDQQDLAVAIAECPVPVVTAIGHEIDRSIADVVAHHACKTPTAAAEFLVDRIGAAALRMDQAAAVLADQVGRRLQEAAARADLHGRLARAARGALLAAGLRQQQLGGRLQSRVGGRLTAAGGRLGSLRIRLAGRASGKVSGLRAHIGSQGPRLARAVEQRLSAAGRQDRILADRLDREAGESLARRGQWLARAAMQVRLQDPDHLLARGYTLTRDGRGRTLRRGADLQPGDLIRTRFQDTEVPSLVQPHQGAGAGSRDSKKGKQGGREQKDTGQETLFR